MNDFFQNNNTDITQSFLNNFMQQSLKQQYGPQTLINQSIPMNQPAQINQVQTAVGSIDTSKFPNFSIIDTGSGKIIFGANEDTLKTMGLQDYTKVNVGGQEAYFVKNSWLQQNLPALKVGLGTALGLGQLGLGLAQLNIAKSNIRRQNKLLDEQLKELKEKYDSNKKARKKIVQMYYS